MPLLKKQSFVKAGLPMDLKENEKVFYCSMTDEIFRNYEEFCQRVILCNSMVWTCSFTGKAGLTYSEAIESEQSAQHLLKDFPSELRIPLLFLASKTHRASFSEMADDVFQFMKDRYFIGENVEASFAGTKWRESHILQVIAPTDEVISELKKNGHAFPPSYLYRYEVEQLDAEDEDVSEVMVVDFEHIRRKKMTFSRERSKLLLKQCVKQDKNGVFVIKDVVLQNFGIHKIRFDQIFDGPLPNFNTSKKLLVKNPVNGKKTKQETLAQFLSKHNGVNSNDNSVNLMEQMKKRQEEFQILKQKKLDEKIAEKQKRKEENIKISNFIKEWYKPKEDLELEDHKVLPVPVPLLSKIPDEFIGEVLVILEFVYSFSKILHTKDFFPDGLTFELMERSLMQKEVAGPLMDVIQMFLSALFSIQADEMARYTSSGDGITDLKENDIKVNLNFTEATLYATVASNWSASHQGLPLNKLPLYSLTTTEVLRLHLLSSGARVNESCAKWRYQHRGGYTSEDDPGLHLCLKHPHILKSLALHSVSEFSVRDKIEIISCLMNQLLTYADVRDIVEDRLEKSKQGKFELKALQITDRKREQEYIVAKHKIQKECVENKKDPTNELHRLDRENETNKVQNERQMEKLLKQSVEHQIILGFDRAYRRYMRLESIPGLFVSCEDNGDGECLSEPVKQNSSLVGADRSVVLAYIRKTFDDVNSNDINSDVTPTLNGDTNPATFSPDELMICSGDPSNCIIHSNKKKQTWSFYNQEEHITELLNSLNKRGLRESELRLAIENDQRYLVSLINNTPVSQLNKNIKTEEPEPKKQSRRKNKYEDTNLGYSVDMDTSAVLKLALIDNILEIEEKLNAGKLGLIKIKDRDAWREHLLNQEFEKLDKTVFSRDANLAFKNEADEGTPNTTIDDCNSEILFEAKSTTESEDSDIECEDLPFKQPKNVKKAIKTLAIALVQVAQGVQKRYLKKPLGRVGVRSTTKRKEYDIIDKWENSLMAVTSYSQIFLYFTTLDKCILWSQSALLARCKVCSRRTDSENMLLCDGCNKGQHLYCLRPKLTSVPEGDWFCKDCLNKKRKEANEEIKKKRIFREQLSDEETSEEINGCEVMEVEEESEEGENSESSESENDEEPTPTTEVCNRCNTGGSLLSCESCSMMYHCECAEPPLRRIPRGIWTCHQCKNKRSKDSSDNTYNRVEHSGVMHYERRCASRARHKIHGFIKTLRRITETEDSDDDNKLKRRSNRREGESRDDLPLHNAPLQELLSDILKQEHAWPFLRPVQKNEVPDYYDIITKPMDFGTIKYKLNMGEYHCDAQVMADASLVFENCNTYNNSDDEVYQCGVELQKYFINRCKELGLKLPEGIEYHLNSKNISNDKYKHKDKKLRTM